MKGDAAKRQGDSKYNWSQWSTWSPCSEECMIGESQGRSRQCLDETNDIQRMLELYIYKSYNVISILNNPILQGNMQERNHR